MENSPKGELIHHVRVAIVTPYYREDDKVLSTCLESVRDLTHADCRHYVVSDGHPNALVDTFEVSHIRFPTAHGDNGNFARCTGALAAMSEGAEAIAFLDADNWFQPDHIARMVALQARTGVALCTSGRSIHGLDGTLLEAEDPESDGVKFTDTSCLCFFQGAFDLLTLWGAMPRVAGPIGDRLMWRAVKLRGVSHAHDPAPTLAFRSQYAHHYMRNGKKPPKGAKTGPDLAKAWAKFRAIPYSERIGMLLGLGGAQTVRALQKPQLAQQVRVREVSVRGINHTLRLEVLDDDGSRSDEHAQLQIEQYQPVPTLSSPRTILDIGANVGLAAAQFRLMYPDASLICVEPDPYAYRLLARNAAIIENCLPVCAALTLGMQTQPFFIAKGKVGNAKSAIPGYRGRSLSIDAERFVRDLGRQDFDMISIATGGAEIPILLSLKNRLATTPAILLDYHNDTDRRVMDALLSDTHFLWHSSDTSPHRGSLCYVQRSQAHGILPDKPL